jgi:hypothetical protein
MCPEGIFINVDFTLESGATNEAKPVQRQLLYVPSEALGMDLRKTLEKLSTHST